MRIEVDTEDITWECGDCGNTYDFGVQACPNNILDKALLEVFNKTERKSRAKK